MAGAGLFVTVATLVISFFPSSELTAEANVIYEITLAASFVVSVAIPFAIYGMRRRGGASAGSVLASDAEAGSPASADADAGSTASGIQR